MQLALTLGVLAVVAVIAVNAFGLDVNEILDSAKNKMKR